MSYAELRSFVETMKALGYPRLISLDNFRAPAFELVADVLAWLMHRLSPESALQDDISTEAQRVRFLQAAAGIALAKTRTRLNLKRLYAADGGAVRELLKLATLLRRATHTAAAAPDEDAGEVLDTSVTLKLLDASAATAAAREVVRAGPGLHDGLRAEAQLRDARLRALAAAQDGSVVEAAVHETLAGLGEGVASLGCQLQEGAASEAQLDARLDKWRGELERAEKRLATLATVRPAYMDEYEALTAQLQVLWAHYLERFRNLQYLEARLECYHRAEQDAADAGERRRRKLQRRLAEEELRILRGEEPAAAAHSRKTHSAGTPHAAGARPNANNNTNDHSDSNSSSDSDDAVVAGGWRGTRGQAGLAGGWQQQRQQQPGGAPAGPRVVGSLTAGWDEEDDADSLADDGSGRAGGGAGRLSAGGSSRDHSAGGGGGGGEDDEDDDEQLLGGSEDSGF